MSKTRYPRRPLPVTRWALTAARPAVVLCLAVVLCTGAAVAGNAPDFKLKDLDGNWFRLKDHVGEVVYVNFWATWCVPCRREMPHIQSVSYTHLRAHET